MTLLQQALEALEESNSEMRDLYFAHPSRQKNDAAIAALRTAIAQAEQAQPDWYHGVDLAGCHRFYSKDEVRPAGFGEGLYTHPQASKPLSEEQIVLAARVLNQRCAELCGVDEQDSWKTYGNEYLDDVRAMLTAVYNIKEQQP